MQCERGGSTGERPAMFFQLERIVAGTEYVGWAKGGTRALPSAARMHVSAGLPAAQPSTTTSDTAPSDRNVIVAREIGESVSKHARAEGNATPSAPLTAPWDGRNGTPAFAVLVVSSGGAVGCGAALAAAPPTASCINASSPFSLPLPARPAARKALAPAAGAGTTACVVADPLGPSGGSPAAEGMAPPLAAGIGGSCEKSNVRSSFEGAASCSDGTSGTAFSGETAFCVATGDVPSRRASGCPRRRKSPNATAPSATIAPSKKAAHSGMRPVCVVFAGAAAGTFAALASTAGAGACASGEEAFSSAAASAARSMIPEFSLRRSVDGCAPFGSAVWCPSFARSAKPPPRPVGGEIGPGRASRSRSLTLMAQPRKI